jgi:hypothetical protein
MLMINGIKIAESNKEAIASPFKSGGTATIFAKRTKRKVMLHLANGEPFGVVTNGVIGSVHRLENGKLWYSYGWPDRLGQEPDYAAALDMARALEIGRDSKGPIYKAS